MKSILKFSSSINCFIICSFSIHLVIYIVLYVFYLCLIFKRLLRKKKIIISKKRNQIIVRKKCIRFYFSTTCFYRLWFSPGTKTILMCLKKKRILWLWTNCFCVLCFLQEKILKWKLEILVSLCLELKTCVVCCGGRFGSGINL